MTTLRSQMLPHSQDIGGGQREASPDAWSGELGAPWLVVAIVIAMGMGAIGYLTPLFDPDLPMHLRVGEWILREGRVPFTEPFAWTRWGAPYYAYSWLAQALYARVLGQFGFSGLHTLQAITIAGSFLVVVWLGRVARWNAWATLLVAMLTSATWATFVAPVRPQALLGISVPLAWLGAEWILRGRWRLGLGVALCAAILTRNTNLLFPLTFIPVLRFFGEDAIPWRLVLGFAAANFVGWMLTPYAFNTIDVLRLYLTNNLQIGPATRISELEPGFRAVLRLAGFDVATLMFVALMLAPVLVPSDSMTNRERVAFGLGWTAGLLVFGLAARGLVIWMLAAMPLLIRIAQRVPRPSTRAMMRSSLAVLVLIPFSLAATEWRLSAVLTSVIEPATSRQLPLRDAPALEPLVRWIECNVRTDYRTRVFNTFDHGSYLSYRLPNESYSIDSRSIFPDSVAIVEVYQSASHGRMKLGPWRSADLAFLPTAHASAISLSLDSSWVLARVSMPLDSAHQTLGLWVRRQWIRAHASTIADIRADTVRVGAVVPPIADCDVAAPRQPAAPHESERTHNSR